MASDLQFLPLQLVIRAHGVAEGDAENLFADITRLVQDAYTQGYGEGHVRGAVVADLARRKAMGAAGDMVDVVHPDGTHEYWSTHCRHGNHEACSATELAAGVPRRPAQCKTCGAPCRCPVCHRNDGSEEP